MKIMTLLDPEDLKFDTVKAGKVTCVRILHLPTGLAAYCESTATERQTRIRALNDLTRRVFETTGQYRYFAPQRLLDQETELSAPAQSPRGEE